MPIPPVIHRYWVRPAPDKDEYGVFVVRYTRMEKMPDSPTGVVHERSEAGYGLYRQSAYLRMDGEWIDFPSGSVIGAFCTFDGRYINPYVGTEDWREAVGNVVEHHIKPYFQAIINIKEFAHE